MRTRRKGRLWSVPPAAHARLTMVCLASLLAMPASGQADPEPWTLGLQPFASPQTLFDRYAPLREWIEEERGSGVTLEGSRDFAQFIDRLRDERYEIAVVAPHVVPLLGDASPYAPIARSRDVLAMVIVAPAESPIRTMMDLEDRTLATPARQSLGTTLARDRVGQVFATNDPPVDYLEFPHPQAAVSAMQRGLADASVLVIDGVALEPHDPITGPERMMALADGSLVRIVAQSKTFPGVTVVLHQRAQTDDLDLPGAFEGLSDTQSGRALLRAIRHTRGFDAASPSDFSGFEGLLDHVSPDHGQME